MSDIARAVKILRAGGLVAFPTETVYGLGADATNSEAVQKIFAAKGRPSANPLIAHVVDATVARRYAKIWPETAERLAQHFWPGPLTLVVARQTAGVNVIASEVTAGLPAVALRAPDHALTLELLKQFNGALAGPSANRSTRISPTTADHVRAELGASVDLILDGGPASVGIESTVLDLTRDRPAILRPGAITREDLEAIIGQVDWRVGIASASEAQSSPGRHAVHYSPTTPAYRFESDQRDSVVSGCESECIVLTFGPAKIPDGYLISMPTEPGPYARQLYSALRRADEQSASRILVEMPPDTSPWAAVRDRLTRATQPLKKQG